MKSTCGNTRRPKTWSKAQQYYSCLSWPTLGTHHDQVSAAFGVLRWNSTPQKSSLPEASGQWENTWLRLCGDWFCTGTKTFPSPQKKAYLWMAGWQRPKGPEPGFTAPNMWMKLPALLTCYNLNNSVSISSLINWYSRSNRSQRDMGAEGGSEHGELLFYTWEN